MIYIMIYLNVASKNAWANVANSIHYPLLEDSLDDGLPLPSSNLPDDTTSAFCYMGMKERKLSQGKKFTAHIVSVSTFWAAPELDEQATTKIRQVAKSRHWVILDLKTPFHPIPTLVLRLHRVLVLVSLSETVKVKRCELPPSRYHNVMSLILRWEQHGMARPHRCYPIF